jgi:hypothetical protein
MVLDVHRRRRLTSVRAEPAVHARATVFEQTLVNRRAAVGERLVTYGRFLEGRHGP